MSETAPERITVVVDEMLAQLIPTFLGNVETSLKAIAERLEAGDFVEVAGIGHRLKGSGGAYGFEPITRHGGRIEQAGKDGDAATARRELAELESYVSRVDVVYD